MDAYKVMYCTSLYVIAVVNHQRSVEGKRWWLLGGGVHSERKRSCVGFVKCACAGAGVGVQDGWG